MGIAVVFPGQGSQVPGAGRAWVDHPAWSVVSEAEEAAGLPLGRLLLDASRDELATTRASQLSVLVASLVAWRAIQPVVEDEVVAVAGHSLGQVTALVAAGVVPMGEGIRLALARAEATTAAQQASPGGMVALLGADEALAGAVCAEAGAQAWPANLNGAGQVVVGAAVDSLDAVEAAAHALGVRRVRRLAVDGAFHTPLMASAARALEPLLRATSFRPPRWPVVTNHDAEAVVNADGWPDRMARHLVEPVRWEDVVSRLVALGASTIVEVGPGSTLTGLVRRIAPEVATRSVTGPGDVAGCAGLTAVGAPR